MLDTAPGPKLCSAGSAFNPQQAVESTQFRPVDVVVVDSGLERLNVIELIQEIKEKLPSVEVIVFGIEHETEALDFIEAGASGCLCREQSFAELVHMIEAAHNGQIHCSPRILASVFARLAELSRRQNHNGLLNRTKLTTRETEILDLIAAGLSNKEIAQRLCIQLYTVKNHIHHILEKLHVNRRREAIRLAYQQGLLKELHPV